MIKFERFTLDNGLKVITHSDPSTNIVAFNLLYNVGSRDESPERTGFAHLFEHLMFEGSRHIPSFDNPLQMVGGDNNAFTNNDITNYYITLPKENLETAFGWSLTECLASIFRKKLDIQKNVVIEEFNQRYLNQPYGDIYLLLRPLAYTMHPYQWATIGKDISHIKNASLQEVKDFFYHHYAPNNAILSVAGNITKNEIEILANKWFGPIESRNIKVRNLPIEPKQLQPRSLTVNRQVPFNAIYKAFHMSSKLHPDYYTTDLISDLLANGNSSRLYQNLSKERHLFSDINAYISGDIDEGLFVVAGKLMKGISIDEAENAINEELLKIATDEISNYELEKVKNKFESVYQFGQLNALNKAMELAYQELLGDANRINQEIDNYRKVTKTDIKKVAKELLM